MGRESFIFYASFYEALKELPDDIRLKVFDAVCEFALGGIEPALVGVEKAIFALIRPQIAANHARYEGGCKGGRPKVKKDDETETIPKPNDNLTITKAKPNDNHTETIPKPNDNENVNDNVNVISTPPLSPPSGGEGDAKSVFFGKYTALKQGRTKDEGIDYNVLLEEFEKSAMLRGMYSFSKIVSMYDAIKRGDFRDKARTVTNPAVDALNAKAEREKWYAERQAKAESIAYAYQRMAKANKRFAELEKELAKMNLELAKAEVAGSDNLIALREYQEQLLEERGRILKKLGIEEHQLVPQYACSKCNDSGFMEDGRACDCYNSLILELLIDPN